MALREYLPGMDFGVGVDALSGTIKGDAVTRNQFEEVTGAGGQQVQFHLERIDTVEDLQESLGVSADVDVSFGPYGGGSARFDFAESCAMHSYSIYLLVRTEVGNAFRQMRDVALKPKRSSCSKTVR